MSKDALTTRATSPRPDAAAGAVALDAAAVAPLVVRVAGLAADHLWPDGDDLLADLCEERRRALAALGAARAELAEWLHQAVPNAPAPARRFLLAVKRDCHNGRPLAPRAGDARLRLLPGELVARVGEGERRLEEVERRFEGELEARQQRELDRLHELLARRDLVRGLALASPSLAANLHRLPRRAGDLAGRKERRLLASVVRYLTRAAYKCSPFSTLTRVGCGELSDDDGDDGGGLRLVDGRWEELSTRRLRYPLHRLRDLLCANPDLRARMQVARNETAEELAPGEHCFVRASQWRVEDGRARFLRESLVRTRLQGPLIDLLLARTGALGEHRELAAAAAAELGEDATAVAGTLDRLLELGFLELLPPWSSDSLDLEPRFVAFLRSLGGDAVGEVASALDRIEAGKRAFLVSDAPHRELAAIDEALADGCRAVSRIAGIEVPIAPEDVAGGNLSEDVFLACRGSGPRPSVARLPARVAADLLAAAEPLFRFDDLLSRRHELLHTVGGALRDRFPGRREVPFLEGYTAVLPLWRSFDRAMRQRRPGVPEEPFNPLGLREIADLHRLQVASWSTLAGALESADAEDRIPEDVLPRLLAEAPQHDGPRVGPCLFVQPADRSGRRWVVNRMFEGTGRYGSRFAAVMDEATRRSNVEHLAAASRLDDSGGGTELLDLMSTRGSGLNVHPLQSRRVLLLPGERIDDPERAVRLRDLRLRVDGGSLLPRLVDGGGTTYLPVHLGHMNVRYLSPLLRFLICFGPSFFEARLPPQKAVEVAPGVYRYPRLCSGPLILRRRRWVFAPASFSDRCSHASDARAFVLVDEWRRAASIPRRVFLTERVPRGTDHTYKPQFLDFASPSCLQVLRASVRAHAADGGMVLEEMLPAPEDYPADAAGRRWAVELQLDWLALRGPLAARRSQRLESQRARDGRRQHVVPFRGAHFPTEPSGLNKGGVGMSEKEKDQNTEIEPLSDDDLDSVAGGALDTDGCPSDGCPSDGCPSDGCPSDGCPVGTISGSGIS